jgi:hypothetical protein
MTRGEALIPVTLLRELVSLDVTTGALTWMPREARHFPPTAKQTAEHKAKNWNRRMAGKPALSYKDQRYGYLTGALLNRSIGAHRVVFALAHGRWPEGEIDHINGKPADNRPTNLRDVPHSMNQRNMKRQRNNTSGTTGVTFDSTHSKWVARIGGKGRGSHVGCYVSKADAVAARKAAERALSYHPNHGRSTA